MPSKLIEKKFTDFVKEIATKLECKDIVKPLSEGFHYLIESEGDELHDGYDDADLEPQKCWRCGKEVDDFEAVYTDDGRIVCPDCELLYRRTRDVTPEINNPW